LIETLLSLNPDLLQGGIKPVNPSELLINDRYVELLNSANAKSDYVFVDTACVN